MSLAQHLSIPPTQTKSVRITFLTRGDKRVGLAGGCDDKRAASHFLNGVLLLIQTHAEDGLNGLTPSVTTQQHSRFKLGRW